MLEEEIARLEGEISRIQHNISSTEESLVQDSEKFNLYEHKNINLISSSNQPSTSPAQTQRINVFEEKVAFESKSMFFINQAIKGAYSNHGFVSNGDSLETSVRKERQRMVNNQERIPWKSGVNEQHPSQKRPPRPPFPRVSSFYCSYEEKNVYVDCFVVH